MRTDLVETAQEIFLGVGGVSSVDIHVEEVLCVKIGVRDRSRKIEYSIYDAELELRRKFPDTHIRVHFVRD